MKSRFYTAQEVAEMLGVHQSTAYKIIKRLLIGLKGQRRENMSMTQSIHFNRKKVRR